jgi:hypothetical protein
VYHLQLYVIGFARFIANCFVEGVSTETVSFAVSLASVFSSSLTSSFISCLVSSLTSSLTSSLAPVVTSGLSSTLMSMNSNLVGRLKSITASQVNSFSHSHFIVTRISQPTFSAV